MNNLKIVSVVAIAFSLMFPLICLTQAVSERVNLTYIWLGASTMIPMLGFCLYLLVFQNEKRGL
jgi:hypothetical protein